MFKLQDSLQSVPNETSLVVRLGRALQPGEYRIRLSLLRIREPEVGREGGRVQILAKNHGL